MCDEINGFIEENMENHTMNLSKEILDKSTKNMLKYDICENGFGGCITDNKKTTKKEMIDCIAKFDIKIHYDDKYIQNNISYHKIL